jgi:AraC-like DNA-binding protein
MGRKSKVSVNKIPEPAHEVISFDVTDDLAAYAMKADSSVPHRLPFYEILTIEEMKGQLFIDEFAFDNPRRKVFLICPGQNRYWDNVSEITGTVIHFGEEFLFDASRSNALWELSIFKEMSRFTMLSLGEKDFAGAKEVLNFMLNEYSSRDLEYISSVRAYINILLILLYRSYEKRFEGDETRGYANLCEAFQRLVLLHVGERRSVNFFAKQLNISMGYLNEKVKKQLGVTPGEVIRQTMVSEAKRLITNTELSMTEVAETLGFDDGSYFCRLFKKEMGISPIKFRQSCYTISEGNPVKRRRGRPPKRRKGRTVRIQANS